MAQQPTPEEIFGTQVRQARETRGWTQDRLRAVLREVAGLELSSTAMTRLEQGKRPIRLNEVTALARVLELGLERYGGGTVRLAQQDELDQARGELNRLRAVAEETTERLERARHTAVLARAAEENARRELDVVRKQIARLEASIAHYDHLRSEIRRLGQDANGEH